MSTSSNHTKAFAQCCHCKHTVTSSRTLLTDHVNPGFRWQKQLSTRRAISSPANWTYILRNKLVKCYIWSTALSGAETRALRKVDQKYVESIEMLCWRRMEKISWTERVRNEEVLLRVKEQRNILQQEGIITGLVTSSIVIAF